MTKTYRIKVEGGVEADSEEEAYEKFYENIQRGKYAEMDVVYGLDLIKIQGILNDIENRIIESEGEDSENRSKVGRAIDLLSQVEGEW